MSELITYTEQDQHCLLQMDDGKANALGFAMCEALDSALDKAAATGKPVVLAGRPGRFSAGFDLAVMSGEPAAMMRLVEQGAALSRRLLSFEAPVALAVSGHAIAMGAVLCLSADYRVGARGAFKIGLNEVAIGMTLPRFALELARVRLAPTHRDRATTLAEIYDPETAVAAGYLDQLADADKLLATATGLADQLSRLDPAAHKRTKARLRKPLLAALTDAAQGDFANSAALTAGD